MHADKLPITGPCPIDLDAIGFDRAAKVAHCTHCAKDVTVLSNMTRGEAREFMRTHKGQKLCVSYARDEQGRIRFREDEPSTVVPLERLVRRAPAVAASAGSGRPARAAGIAAAIGLTVAMAACTPHGDPPPQPRVEIT
ncbi:MAG: hypothetical protein KDK70_42110, partial [Myxococcales bacterium]|nr:hypothetical protein [Myxococcales bacterium]